MNPKKLVPFFEEVGKQLKSPVRVVLTGGAVLGIYAQARFTQDLNFAVEAAEGFEAAVEIFERVAVKHDLDLQYSEDIGNWSQLSLLDWRQNTIHLGTYWKLTVDVLSPLYFSLGKIARSMEQDLQDISDVFRAKNVRGEDVVALWIRALKESPKSSAIPAIKKYMKEFLSTGGRGIWDNGADLVQMFEEKVRRL